MGPAPDDRTAGDRTLALRLRRKMLSAECRRRATTIRRYLDNQGRPDHQADACDTHASELSAELRVIDRRRPCGYGTGSPRVTGRPARNGFASNSSWVFARYKSMSAEIS